MKTLKKLGSFLLAAIMMMALAVPVAAAGNGKITITNASASQTYTAYKVFDATYNETTKTTAYSVQAGDVKTAAEAANSPFVVASSQNSEGAYAVSLKEGATTQDVLNWMEANKGSFTEAGTQTPVSGNTVEFDVAYGYYYITSSLGAAVTVNTNTPSVEVIDKNTTNPDIPSDGGKKIVTGENTTVSANSAAIGDTVDFQVTFNATNFETKDGVTTKITEYTITDTPNALKIDADTIVVTVDGVPVEPTVKTVDAQTGIMTIKLAWVDAAGNSIYASPAAVKVTYSAVVTADAQDGSATNGATISYNDKEIEGGTTETKTYSFELTKTDNENAQLTGAEFRLYDAQTGGNEIAVVKNQDGSYRVAAAEEGGVVIEAGKVTVKGLKGDTTYYLEETKAPEGYNMLTERVPVTIGTTNTSVSVINESGAELPSTGGMGTTIFYVLGGLMVVFAGVLLITKKRMSLK